MSSDKKIKEPYVPYTICSIDHHKMRQASIVEDTNAAPSIRGRRLQTHGTWSQSLMWKVSATKVTVRANLAQSHRGIASRSRRERRSAKLHSWNALETNLTSWLTIKQIQIEFISTPIAILCSPKWLSMFVRFLEPNQGCANEGWAGLGLRWGHKVG